jgi:hypothetical protein
LLRSKSFILLQRVDREVHLNSLFFSDVRIIAGTVKAGKGLPARIGGSHIGPRIGNKALSIGHPDLGKGLGIEYFLLLDDAVEIKKVGDQGIDLFVGQRSGTVKGHGAIDVVPKRRGIGPVAAHCLHRFETVQGPFSTHQGFSLFTPLTFRAVAVGTATGIDFLSFHCPTLSRREFLSIRTNTDVPALDLLRSG